MENYVKEFNATDYESRYKKGYGHQYPESHIIRIYKHIIEWELGIKTGKIFDFGCGAGANLSYFTNLGFTPYGCDTSETAIKHCKNNLSDFEKNFTTTPVNPDLLSLVEKGSLDIFLSNQVLYFLDNKDIATIVNQAYQLLKPNGVFIATMMSTTCWYSKFIKSASGDFKVVELETPREKGKLLINFKQKEEMTDLFKPFTKIHLGSYGSHIREEEGSTDHWIFVGIKK